MKMQLRAMHKREKIYQKDINPKTLYAWVTAYKKQHNLPMRNIEIKTTLKESESEELKCLRVKIRYSNKKEIS